MKKKGLIFIVFCSLGSLIFVLVTMNAFSNAFIAKNLLRVALFSIFSIFIYLNPQRINFFGDASLREANIKLSYFLAYLVSSINIFLTIMFFVESNNKAI
jgi:hypothetical protein